MTHAPEGGERCEMSFRRCGGTGEVGGFGGVRQAATDSWRRSWRTVSRSGHWREKGKTQPVYAELSQDFLPDVLGCTKVLEMFSALKDCDTFLFFFLHHPDHHTLMLTHVVVATLFMSFMQI